MIDIDDVNVPLDEMTMLDLAAMFAMMGIVASDSVFSGSACYWYASELLKARKELLSEVPKV